MRTIIFKNTRIEVDADATTRKVRLDLDFDGVDLTSARARRLAAYLNAAADAAESKPLPPKAASVDWYVSVYGQDVRIDGPRGWIQWKGTNVCMDVYCECGRFGHVDAEFVYFYRCPQCSAVYAVGQNVKLIKLTPTQLEHPRFRHGIEPVSDAPEVKP